MRPRGLVLVVSFLALFSVPLSAARIAYGRPADGAATRGAGIGETSVLDSTGPTVTSVSPDEAYDFRAQVITISGSNFAPLAMVTLGQYSLDDVTFVDTGTVTATVPAELPDRSYSITLTNPDGQSSTLADAFTVLRSRDGLLGKWEFVSPMSKARDGLALIQAGAFLYALGGYDRERDDVTGSVERAEIKADGSLGPWRPVARMTTGRHSFAAVHADGYLYALGGMNNNGSILDSVERAKINPDGTLGPWTADAPMTTIRRRFGAASSDHFLYAVGGGLERGNSVERAAIQPDGSLGAWEPIAAMTMSRDGLAAVAFGGQLYALGGTVDNSVERATIQPDGSLGAWVRVSSTSVPRLGLGAFATDGYLYAVGGFTYSPGYNSPPYTSVERAPINTDGSLGRWELTSSLTVPREQLAVAAAGNFLYAAGGFGDSSLSSVERAEISPLVLTEALPASLAPSHTGTLTFRGQNFLPDPLIRLQSDIALQSSFVSTRTLSATLPATLGRGWYTATLTNGDGRGVMLANAFLLNEPLSLLSMTPNVAANNLAAPVTIKGTNFLEDGIDVRIGNVPLHNVRVLDDTTIVAVVPPNRAAGRYTLTVSHRHAQSAVLREAFTVLSGRDGSLSPWQVTSPMEIVREAGGVAVAAGGWIYAMGGSPNIGRLADVERAPILPNGSLGPWQPERSMTTARYGHAAIVVGSFLYVLGGGYGPVGDRNVERAEILADGSLGPWEAVSPMNSPRYFFPVVAHSGYLFALGGQAGQHATTTVERAAVNPDGTLGPWEYAAPLTTPRFWHAGVAVGGYLYVFGGYDYRTHIDSASVERAPLRPDGTLGPWRRLANLPEERAQLAAVEVGDYIYLLGGSYDGGPRIGATVLRAAVDPSGRLGAWQQVPAMTVDRTSLMAVEAQGYLYALGGHSYGEGTTGGLRSVEFAALSPPKLLEVEPDVVATGDDLTISGLNFMPSADVRLLGSSAAAGDDLAMQSAPGSLAASDGAAGLATTYVTTRTLEARIPDGLLSGWYTATLATSAGKSSTKVNAILVDASPPAASISIEGDVPMVVSPTVNLTLSAEDAHTDVAHMGFSNDGRTWSPWEAYATSKAWSLLPGEGTRTVRARFRDRVGNVAVVTDVILLDSQPPAAVLAALEPFQAATSFQLSWSGSDGASGVASYDLQFRDGDGNWRDWLTATAGTSTEFVGEEGRTYHFRVRARDRAGHVGAYSTEDIATTIDLTAPVAESLVINGGARNSTSSTVWLTLTASDGGNAPGPSAASTADAGSGPSDVSISNDGRTWSSWEPYAAETTWSLPAGSGYKTVYARVRDAAGNLSTVVSDTIEVDLAVDAEYGVEINGGAAFANQEGVTLAIGAPPGTAAIKVSNTPDLVGVMWQPYVSRQNWTLGSPGASGPRRVYVQYRHVTGTISDLVEDQIVLDVVAPAGSVSIAEVDNTRSETRTVTLQLRATDDASGVAHMRLSNRADFAGTGWQPYATSSAWTLAERDSVYVQFRDGAGNTSMTYSARSRGASSSTSTRTATGTAIPSATSSTTPVPSAAASGTPLPPTMSSATPAPLATSSATPAPTATASAIPMPSATTSSSPAPTATAGTPVPTSSPAMTGTPAGSPSSTGTATLSPAGTPTPTGTAVATRTALPAGTATATVAPSTTVEATRTPAPSRTPIGTPARNRYHVFLPLLRGR